MHGYIAPNSLFVLGIGQRQIYTRPPMRIKTHYAVHFPVEPTTSVSRPMKIIEHTIAVDFEQHAQDCTRCARSLHHRRAAAIIQELCEHGKWLAEHLSRHIYGSDDGHAYSTAMRNVRYFRVEIPPGFTSVLRLLGLPSASLRRRTSRRYFASKSDRHQRILQGVRYYGRPC